jgi:hypothetical protein
MKGWPHPKDLQRQTWLATNALALADSHQFLTIGYILDRVREKLRDGKADSAEEALRQLYQEYERPAPDCEGQLHLIIQDGALIAPGEEFAK